MRRRSTGMMVTGIVLTSAGAVTLLTGITLGGVGASCTSDLNDKYPDHVLPSSERDELDRCQGYSTASAVLLLGGLVLAGVGVPLWVVGARKTSLQQPSASLIPWLAPKAGGVVLHWRL